MFDDRLEKLREEKGLNKKEAAKKLNMAYTTYIGYEKNEREPNSEVLIGIAKFFNVDIDYLLGISPCKRKENFVLINEINLSERSIDFIKSLDNCHEIRSLNFLLENDEFRDLLCLIDDYKIKFQNKETANKSFDDFNTHLSEYQRGFYATENVKDYEHIIFNVLIRKFEKIVGRLRDI